MAISYTAAGAAEYCSRRHCTFTPDTIAEASMVRAAALAALKTGHKIGQSHACRHIVFLHYAPASRYTPHSYMRPGH